MKGYLISLLALAAFANGAFVPLSHQEVKNEFHAFKLKYNKKYSSEEDEMFRFGIFKDNINEIKKHNEEYERREHTYSMVVNQLADLREDEWLAHMGGGCLEDPITEPKTDNKQVFVPTMDPEDLPKSIDWDELGYVTGPKRQRGCGSCWAFSALRPMEASYKRKTGNLETLSAQQLVDCANNHGCHGGLPGTALKYGKEAGGLARDSDYPYHAVQEQCKANQTKLYGPLFDSYMKVETKNVQALKEAIATQGPVTAGVCASRWGRAGNGIFYDENLINCHPNHGVSIVGYGRLDDYEDGPIKDYWLMRNNWGDTRNIKIAMGVNMINIERSCNVLIVDGFVPDWMKK